MDDLTTTLQRARVVPVLREKTAEEALTGARRLHDAGFTCVEVTTSVPGWDGVIGELRRDLPALTTAAGTVVTAEQADQAIAAGAHFLVSPHAAPEARRRGDRTGVPFIEGGLTPGEVASATRQGVAKLFPAHLGGPRYLRDLLTVLPGAQIMPTGGIAPEDVESWLEAGAVAVGIGSALAHRADLEDLAALICHPTRNGEST